MRWAFEPGPPTWQTWMKLLAGVPDDPILDAARSLLWADLLPWNAAAGRTTGRGAGSRRTST